MTSYSFYSPSALSELLTIVATVCGVVIGVTLGFYFHLTGVLFWVETIAVIVVLALPAWLSFGYVLTFDKSAQAVMIHVRLLGVTLGRKGYGFEDVKSITMHYDGDGFPFIRVDLVDQARYYFLTEHTERDYQLLVGLFDRPSQISAGAVSPTRV